MRRWCVILGLVVLAGACGDDHPAAGGKPDAGDGAPDRAPDGVDAPDADGGGADRSEDSARDAASEDARDAASEAPADASTDAISTMASCPVSVAPRDICGCGCCGQPQGRACWYPGLGQQSADIPDPRPPNCNAVGCSAGVRYLCCADPGRKPDGAATYCARDLATAIDRIELTRREGSSCTFVLLERFMDDPQGLPVATTPGWSVRGGRRACDGSVAATPAIGGLGTASLTAAGALARLDAHVALFFDDGSGVATPVRLDVDGLPLSPGCP